MFNELSSPEDKRLEKSLKTKELTREALLGLTKIYFSNVTPLLKYRNENSEPYVYEKR